jgi:Fimbrial assembly protein (PilN)
MADIDLIPADYRRWLSHKTVLVRYAVTIALINLAFLAAGLLLARTVTANETEATRLKAENAVTQQQQTQLQQLDAQQSEYERRWSLLRGLRAGAAIDDIFVLIDQSIVAGDLWFLDWSFRRAGVIVDGQQQGVETGYFIIVNDSTDPLNEDDLAVETHMTIRGQAKDHQALSTFVRMLFEQRDVKDVNVKRTSRTGYANGQVVEFDLRIILNSVLRDS